MLQIYYKAFELVKKFFFFFGISNKSFIEDETYFMFAMMNTKYLKKITRRSYRRSKSVLELKNRGKMCKPMPESKQTRYESTGISSDWETPQTSLNIRLFCYFHVIHIKNVDTRFHTSIEEMVNKFDLAQVINPEKQKMMASQYRFLQLRKALQKFKQET